MNGIVGMPTDLQSLSVQLDDNERLCVIDQDSGDLELVKDFVARELVEKGMSPNRLEAAAGIDHSRGWTFLKGRNYSTNVGILLLMQLGYTLHFGEA